ncbi:MAG: zinc ribbon domain-containing protein [Thermodesulfobacteriota bacterium]
MMQTKEEVLAGILAAPKPCCPHCGEEMSIWEVPDMNFSDGLGWGTPYLFVCFNNHCPSYASGWDEIKNRYAHRASTRCICYPGTTQYEYMPVFGEAGGTGQIVDEEALEKQRQFQESIKQGFRRLAECYAQKDLVGLLSVLTDPLQPNRVLMKAAEMAGDIGDVGFIEPLKNLKMGNELVQKKVEEAVKAIHARTFTRECPFCAEIIKNRANVCKHCGKDLADA